jgi:DNA-binding beta-propeller fold protein YncE
MALPKETYTIPLKTVYPKDALKDLILDFNFCSDKQSNYRVQLLDKVKNTSTEVTDLGSYHYQINTTEDKKENRFELVFTGIDQNSNTQILEQNKFVVFPNPSNDGQIYVANSQNQTLETISIKNQLGQTVKEWQLNQASSLVPINIQELPAGIYILQISQPNNIENHSIIIK